MYEYKAKLLEIKDGDTFVADVSVGFYMTKNEVVFRMVRINAPEIGTPEGKEAKDFLASLIGDLDHLIIRSQKDGDDFGQGGFGRYLAEIVLPDGRLVSDVMLESGHAVLYKRKKREKKDLLGGQL